MNLTSCYSFFTILKQCWSTVLSAIDNHLYISNNFYYFYFIIIKAVNIVTKSVNMESEQSTQRSSADPNDVDHGNDEHHSDVRMMLIIVMNHWVQQVTLTMVMINHSDLRMVMRALVMESCKLMRLLNVADNRGNTNNVTLSNGTE